MTATPATASPHLATSANAGSSRLSITLRTIRILRNQVRPRYWVGATSKLPRRSSKNPSLATRINSMKKLVPEHAILIPEHAERVFQGKIFDVYQWPQKLYDGSTATFE